MEKLKNLKHKKRKLQKRTIRRTYKTGKSNYKPSISVLLTNKTIKSNILEKEQKLKQVPIEEQHYRATGGAGLARHTEVAGKDR